MALSPAPSPGLAGRTLVFVLAAVAVIVLAGGTFTYRSYERQVRAEIGAQLEAVAALKAGELAQWRRERTADARFFTENRIFAELARQYLYDGDPVAGAEIRAWFDRMRSGDRYARASLLDLEGAVRLGEPEDTRADESPHDNVARHSHRSGSVVWVDFHRGESDAFVHLTLLAPIAGADGAPLATVSLSIDPRVYLYPFIRRWPIPARTAETFIARREDDELVYLHPLRFDPDAALSRRVPLTNTDVPEVRAAIGEIGVFEGVDYRGVPVVAAVRMVPDSPWVLVARMDPSEAWAPIRERLRQTVLIGLLFIVAAGGGLTSYWQRTSARADEALRDSEQRYRQLFTSNPHPMWVFDADTLQFLAVNDAAVTHYGWTRERFLQMTIAEIRPDEDLPRLREDIARSAPTAMGEGKLWRHFTADGSLIDVEIASHPIEFDGRRAVLVLANDVTARRRAEAEVRQLHDDLDREFRAGARALARLEALLEASPTILYTLAADDPSLPATWVSDNVTRILGYTADEALAPGWWSAHLHPGDRDRAIEENALVLDRREIVHEYRFEGRHGRYRVIRDEMRVVEGPDGREVVGAWTDLTAQREAEAQQRLQLSVLEAAANAILVTSVHGVIEWANPAFERLTGYTLQESVGHTPGELIGSGHHGEAFYREMWDTVRAGGVWQGELVNRRKDGSLYDEEMTITPVRDESGAIAHFVAIKHEVTERNNLQAQLMQAQRIESVGRLAGGVAHDFNNLLTVINSYAELALEDLEEEHPLRPSLIEIHKAGERAAGLTRQLLAFSRKQVLQPRDIDLQAVVINMEQMLRRLIGEDVSLVVSGGPEPCMVRADPGQVEQVLMNLAVNSRDAMPAGGSLTIDTRVVDVDARASAEHPGLTPGRWVRMQVSDTGEGMSADTRAQAFEPFFTTKALGKGTGLGLPTVYGIVQQSGGAIWVDSTPGQGAHFVICLPHIGGAVTQGDTRTAAAAVHGSESVLIVEDDDMLRELAKHVVAGAGYEAHTAASGENALLLLEQLERPVDLLLTDIVMPGLSGRELAQRVLARWPGVKVLYMSGYTDDAILRHGVLDGRTRLLNKPFSRGQLLLTVREVLDGT